MSSSSALGTVLFSFLATYLCYHYLLKKKSYLGFVAPPNKDVSTHTQYVPLIGGTVFFAVTSCVILLVTVRLENESALYFAGIVPLWLLGWWKDRLQHPISPFIQLMVQLLSCSLLYYVWLTATSRAPDLLSASLFFVVCIALINGHNFLDVLDGLAGCVSVVTLANLTLLGFLTKQTNIIVVALPFLGVLPAFLLFNWRPAKLFMGDTGSFGLIYTTIYLAVQLPVSNHIVGAIQLLCICFVPLFEFSYTLIRRMAKSKSVYVGDSSHLSLRLLSRNWTTQQIVVLFAGIALLFNGVAYLLQS